MTLVFFCVSALDILGALVGPAAVITAAHRDRIVEWIYSNQVCSSFIVMRAGARVCMYGPNGMPSVFCAVHCPVFDSYQANLNR